MANELLNKLKLIDNSRKVLDGILKDKNINVSTPSFPNLVNAVNELQAPDYQPEDEWTGVPEMPEPKYWKPDLDFDTIYNNDTDKDTYPIVAMVVFLADIASDTLPASAIKGFNHFKFSDDNKLVDGSSNNSIEHTWNKENDVDVKDTKYRYVMCYADKWYKAFELDYDKVIPYAVIIFKGEYDEIKWRKYYNAPAYMEIKEDVIEHVSGAGVKISGTASTGDNCLQPITFVSNSSYTYFSDYCFCYCKNLKFIKNDGTNTINVTTKFRDICNNCTSLEYVHLKYIRSLYYEAFKNVSDAYLQFDTIGPTGNNNDDIIIGSSSSSSYSTVYYAFANTKNLKIRIGTVNGAFKYFCNNISLTSSSIHNYRCENSELEIDTINGDVGGLTSGSGIFKGIKINRIKGNISDNAFNGQNLIGEIVLGYDTLEEAGVHKYTISSGAFSETNIKKIQIKYGYDSIYGFSNCHKLLSLELGNSVTKIQYSVASYCEKLSTLNIPDNVVSLGDSAFNYSYIQNLLIRKRYTNIKNKYV